MTATTNQTAHAHISLLARALVRCEAQWDQAQTWGVTLAERLPAGARLLVAGNGGSAAQAQHLSAEIVGRYCRDRQPFSAISLHSDTSAVTAIANDYGAEEIFARQVQAHMSGETILMLLSTSGRSPNLIRAAQRAADLGGAVWAMTGPAPNPLAALADQALCIDAPTTAAIQELHLVALHLVCEAMDEQLLGANPDAVAL
jgi:D-sedoheptulose 7-phosphate isomerase